MIDVFRNNQFPALTSDVTGLNYNLRRKLMLHVQAEVLHVRGPEILIDSVHSERRLRRDAAKDWLVLDYGKCTAIVLNAKDRIRAAGISRGTPPAGPCTVVNEEVSVCDIVVDTPGAADHRLTAAGRRKSKSYSRGKVVQVARIEGANGLRRNREPPRCIGKKR